MWPYYLLTAALGYLLGSIPTGYLIGRAYGIDVREHGSGNIGATNVVRVLGKKPGYFVFTCDALKGFLSVWLANTLSGKFCCRTSAVRCLKTAWTLPVSPKVWANSTLF